MYRVILSALFLLMATIAPAHADFAAGKNAYDTKNWDQAVTLLRPLAESGDDRAMVLLGDMYTHGHGVARNAGEAYTLYRRAALAGNNDAMIVTAAMLQQGLGTTADIPLAIAWYKRAADSGHPGGAFFYALYLLKGHTSSAPETTLTPDFARAYQWLLVVTKNSKDDNLRAAAEKMTAELEKKLDDAQAGAARTAANQWAPLPVDQLGPAPGISP